MALPYDAAEAVATLTAADPVMAGLIARVGNFELTLRPDEPFPALVRAITYQQLSGKAAATIHGRLRALFPEGLTPEALLALPEETLRGAGLSRNKLAAVRDLAAKTLDGTVPDRARLAAMDDAEVVERLTAVRGVGVWTAEMLLLFNLGRPDVLPVHDLGVRRGYHLAYETPEMPTPRELFAEGERWRPFRSAASWYLWRAADGAAAL